MQMTIEVPNDLSAEISREELLLDLATGMYVAEHATKRQAAELANISEIEFLVHLKKSGIHPYYDTDDWEHDLKSIASLLKS